MISLFLYIHIILYALHGPAVCYLRIMFVRVVTCTATFQINIRSMVVYCLILVSDMPVVPVPQEIG